MDNQGKFFIGRVYDVKAKKTLQEDVFYDPDDLTTHGVVVGMTGSGKTGLCIDILEEAALNGIPALLVDPKGDIGNLLLHFPNMTPEDFRPWMDADEARRLGKTVDQLAAEVSEVWRKGLAGWGIGAERIEQVRNAVGYAVYTPGSDAGIPVSVLSSLEAPTISWDGNEELLLERISSTVTAILGLVGIQADPVRSREHILMANLFETAWRAGQDLDLMTLIQQIQRPPFEQLGALGLEQFFPSNDRFEMAMSLNNLLASPSFRIWTQGVPLDIQSLLWDADGHPRHSVFYISHLPDNERMFFVTLLLSTLETWVRTQSGSSTLRAMLHFDEVFGFLPPVAMPPSKPPLLRLLKQARAFGFGLLLATQNPVDLDYKALSNAGTWLVGRLQTEQDKARLLDGLEGAAAGQGGFSRSKVDNLISALGSRAFLLHNVHAKQPQVFQTRWAMAYLKGPITRTQLRELNQLVGAEPGVPQAAVERPPSERPVAATVAGLAPVAAALAVRPAAPTGVEEVFLPHNLTVAQALKAAGREGVQVTGERLVYKPGLLAQAVARYLDRRVNLDHVQTIASLLTDPDARGFVRWEDATAQAVDRGSLDSAPAPNASFAELRAPLNDPGAVQRLRTDFLDYVAHSAELKLFSNPSLKLVASPGTSSQEFAAQCAEAAKSGREAEAEKIKADHEKKLRTVRDRLAKEERELSADQSELSGRKMEEIATGVENVIGLFSGSRSRRRISSSLTKRRMTSKAKAAVEESVATIEDLKRQVAEADQELAVQLNQLEERWNAVAGQVVETVFRPLKKDILLDVFGIGWVPYWRLETAAGTLEVPAHAQGPSA